jgi:hypothetical protein
MRRSRSTTPSNKTVFKKRITSIEQLKQEARRGADFALLLQYGLFSRKTIAYDESSEHFSVWNHIDDTHENFTEAELSDRNLTNIGEGIRKGALVKLREDSR